MDAEKLMNIIHSAKMDKNNSKITLIICENIEHLKLEFKKDILINSQYIKGKYQNSKTIEFKSGHTFKYITKNSIKLDGYRIRGYEIRTNSIAEELFNKVKDLKNKLDSVKSNKM